MARPRVWDDQLFTSNPTIGTKVVDLLPNIAAEDNRTVTRIIGTITFAPASLTNQVDVMMRLNLGIGVTTAEAFAIPAVPDPQTDSDVPMRGWLYIGFMVYTKYHGGGAVMEAFDYPTLRFDVRASRKVDRGRLFLAFSHELMLGTTETTFISGRIRSLMLT